MDGSIRTIKHHNRSLRSALLHHLLRPFRSSIFKPGKPLPPGSPQLHPPASVAHQCHVSERRIDDVWIYDLTARSQQVDGETQHRTKHQTHQVYYIAGGSFSMLPSSDHWKFVAELSKKIPCSVISLISPPLAPHSPAPQTFSLLVTLFKTLLNSEERKTVSFAGDSSGGKSCPCCDVGTLEDQS